MPRSSAETSPDLTPALATLVDATHATTSPFVFGLNSSDRLRRTLTSAGHRIVDASELQAFAGERAIAVCTSHFFDVRLIATLAERVDDVILLVDDADGLRAVAAIAPAHKIEQLIPALQSGVYDASSAEAVDVTALYATDLVPAYDTKLRKHAPAFVLPATADRASEAERRIFDASYKGTTDFVTKWVWPLPARIVTGWCARLGIVPNAVTALSYLLVGFTLVAFAQGAFGAGLASAWLMTFLDTVDGKLARVTLTTSKLGDFLDHGLDIVHPPLWWAAWAVGLFGTNVLLGTAYPWVWVVVAGYVVGRLLEGLFILAFGQEMFIWRPFDIRFRLVIARRNPNLVLLTVATVIARPDLGLVAVGTWTLCCIAIQCVRIAQAAVFKLRGHEIQPFVHE